MTIPTIGKLWVALAILVGPSVSLVPAAAPSRVGVLTWENDSLARGGDSGYTQGLKLAFLGREHALATNESEARWLSQAAPGINTELQRFGIALGQTMFTPADLRRRDLIANDRPYAGWSYLGLLYRRSGYLEADQNKKYPVLESLELDIGVVGPSSKADEIQKFVHGIGRWQKPRGWEHQLKDEPGFVLDYLRLQVIPVDLYNLRFDFIPTLGLSVGTVAIHADMGAFVRLAFNTPKGVIHLPSGTSITTPLAIGDSSASVGRRNGIGGYLFAGAEGRAVLRNVFLDGNTFRSSHSIDKETFVADFKAGVALIFKNWEFSYTYVYRTKEFQAQPAGKSFGSVSLTRFF